MSTKLGYWHVHLDTDSVNQAVNQNVLLCKPEPDGWLVWLRRVDGSVLFNRTWDEYVAGFGDPDGNYWLGLEYLHLLTGTGTKHKLRVEMESWDYPDIEWAEYDDFSVNSATSKYRIQVGGFTGNTSFNAMRQSNGYSFTTINDDNDGSSGNCANMTGGGGWWYFNCADTKPTGVFARHGSETLEHMHWYNAFGVKHQPLKSMTWKIMPM